jgi:hypothetical protein
MTTETQHQRLARVIAARANWNFSKTLQRYGRRVMSLDINLVGPGAWPKVGDLTDGQAQQFADLIETNIPIPVEAR